MNRATTREINGDDRLGAGDRLRYLWRNALANLCGARRPAFRAFARWSPPQSVVASARGNPTSPGRLLAEAFIVHELPGRLPPGPIKVLEIGCGAGRTRRQLVRAGYNGRYTGLDVEDRFDRAADIPEFEWSFLEADAHTIETGPRYDLVLSNSALEHIADDRELVDRLRACLRPGGVQLHIVPSGTALLAYLWHGWRQYPAGALGRRFDPATTEVFGLGGMASLLVHLTWITLPEQIFRLALRTRARRAYGACVRLAFGLDRIAPFGAPMYAVIEHAPAGAAAATGGAA